MRTRQGNPEDAAAKPEPEKPAAAPAVEKKPAAPKYVPRGSPRDAIVPLWHAVVVRVALRVPLRPRVSRCAASV